jgi:hypothetical protein
MSLENFGKGLPGDIKDPRDYQLLGAGRVTVDWSKPFSYPEPPDENQASSNSCTAQAIGYAIWQQIGEQMTRRDNYSRVALPSGVGAYALDAIKAFQKGNTFRDVAVDPNPQTEAAMTQKVTVEEAGKRRTYKLSYWRPQQQDIDGIAWCIQNYKGVVGAVYGNNQGWANLSDPRPPQNGESMWGHFIHYFGYEMRNGQKAVKAKSSWCDGRKPTVHFINETYFNSLTGTFGWYIIQLEETENMFVQTINNKGKVGVVVYADTIENYKFLCKTYNVTPQVDEQGNITTDLTI